MNDNPKKEAGLAPSEARSQESQTDRNVATSVLRGKTFDLTSRSQTMGRDECIVWPNKTKDSEHPTRPDFRGTIRLSVGAGPYYSLGLWKGKNSFNLWFTPWDKVSRTGVAPASDLTPIKIKLLPTRSGDPAFSGETRKAVVELRPASCNGQEVFWLKLVAKKGVGR